MEEASMKEKTVGQLICDSIEAVLNNMFPNYCHFCDKGYENVSREQMMEFGSRMYAIGYANGKED
jgi:hypothetical protein